MQTSLQLMYTCVKTEPKQLATRNPTCWDQDNHSWHHFKRKPEWSSFKGSGSGRDWQALSSSILDTHLHRWLSLKRHKKRRMWCLHQAPRQTSIICVSSWWDTVLKLQSWSASTAECHRSMLSWEEKPKKAVVLTDSLSALQAFVSGEPDSTQKKITENISTLAQTTCVALQWIPAHTSIMGNDIADQLAKEGREKDQPPSHLSCREVKTLIHNKKKQSSTARLEDTAQTSTHSIIFCLRTGHCRLNSHLKRIGVKTSAQCPCGEVDETPEHYLQSCSLHQQARQQIWPTCVSLKTKLWRSTEDFIPDIQVCGTHRGEDLVNATITSNAEEEEEEEEEGEETSKLRWSTCWRGILWFWSGCHWCYTTSWLSTNLYAKLCRTPWSSWRHGKGFAGVAGISHRVF